MISNSLLISSITAVAVAWLAFVPGSLAAEPYDDQSQQVAAAPQEGDIVQMRTWVYAVDASTRTLHMGLSVPHTEIRWTPLQALGGIERGVEVEVTFKVTRGEKVLVAIKTIKQLETEADGMYF